MSQNAQYPQVDIKPRKMSFPFSQIETKNVFANNSVISAFAAALSSTFPPGEAEFIESVRNYRSQISDDVLKQQIRGFIGQEGHHSHQHKRANQALKDLGFDAVRLEKRLEKDLVKFRKRRYFTPKFRLAMTVGMEHLTAIMAEFLLENPELIEPMEDSVKELLYWHAVEEIEHKAVAFDVYMQCEGDQKYLRRMLRFGATMFSLRIAVYMVALLWWAKKMPSWQELKGFASFMWGKKGLVTKIKQPYKDYFKPSFHPWDHDNQELVDKWKKTFYRPEHDRDSEQFESQLSA